MGVGGGDVEKEHGGRRNLEDSKWTNGSLEAREAVLNIYQDVQTGFQDVLDQCALRHVVPPTWPVHKPVSELRPVVISDPLGLAKVLNHPWSILMTSSLLDDLPNFPTNG